MLHWVLSINTNTESSTFSDTALKKAECQQLQKLLIPTPTAQSEEKTSTFTGGLLLVHLGMTSSCTSMPTPEPSALLAILQHQPVTEQAEHYCIFAVISLPPCLQVSLLFQTLPRGEAESHSTSSQRNSTAVLWGPSAHFHAQKARAGKELKAIQFSTSSNWSVRAGG